jgi:sugar-specific transcriptional regulator TrmB
MLNEQKERLKDRMYKLQKHLDELEEDKKSYNASYNEQIKGVKKNIKFIIECIEKDDWAYLFNAFSEEDIKKFQNG